MLLELLGVKFVISCEVKRQLGGCGGGNGPPWAVTFPLLVRFTNFLLISLFLFFFSL